MNVLQIVAHPDLSGDSFTSQLAESFRDGAEHSGHAVTWFNVYDPASALIDVRQEVLNADHICFAFPCWWEMPPAKLVELLQTIFVKDFAFHLEGDRMIPDLKITVTCLISLGRTQALNTHNLNEAMQYCGLYPEFATYLGVGPMMSNDQAGLYLMHSQRTGQQIRKF